MENKEETYELDSKMLILLIVAISIVAFSITFGLPYMKKVEVLDGFSVVTGEEITSELDLSLVPGASEVYLREVVTNNGGQYRITSQNKTIYGIEKFVNGEYETIYTNEDLPFVWTNR